MARPVGSGAILEVTIDQTMNAQTLLNIFHFRLQNTGSAIVDGDDVTGELALKVLGAPVLFPEALRALCPANWRWNSWRTQWINPTRYTTVSYDFGAGIGDALTSNTPQNVALVGTKKAVEANRHGIGSWHFGGLVGADLLNGVITATGRTKMELIGDTMIQVIDVTAVPNALSLSPIIYNRVAPADSLRAVEYVIQNTVRVERRRTVGLGI